MILNKVENLIDIEQIIATMGKMYSPLTDECKTDLKNVSKLFTQQKSTLLVKEGEFADKIYFIVEGCVRAFYIKDGKEISDWFAFENDFINSINSFHLNIPSPHYIDLIETSTILEVSRDAIYMLTEKHHCFEKLGRIAVTKTMLQLQQRIASIQFESALQKYESLLTIRPDITQRVPLTHIASYLGITLETLSRIRNPKNRI